MQMVISFEESGLFFEQERLELLFADSVKISKNIAFCQLPYLKQYYII